MVACFFLLLLASNAPAVDLATDLANLGQRQFFLRIGIEHCDAERPVVRLVCDGDFVLHDREGRALYSGSANTPLRITCRDTQPATSGYYFILATFDEGERSQAEAFAEKAAKRLRRRARVVPDPRVAVAPSAVGKLGPAESRLAVLVGPYADRSRAGRDEGRVFSAYKHTILHRTQAEPARGRIEARDGKGRLLAKAKDYLALRPTGADSLTRARKLRGNYENWDQPNAWMTKENRAYRDQMELWINPEGRLSIVNRVFLEHYIYGVVVPEIGSGAPFEMKKAQAVIARSEAIAKLRMNRHAGWPHDLCDAQHCQVYKGALVETASSNAAVDATWGQVVVSGNAIADAVYCHSCGGVTANSEDVWGGDPTPHLRSQIDAASPARTPDLSTYEATEAWLVSRPDVFCNPNQKGYPKYSSTRNFRWAATYSAAGLGRQIARVHGDRGTVTDLGVVRRSPSGRVQELRIRFGSREPLHLKGEWPIRKALRLKSSFFTLSRDYDSDHHLERVLIKGAGWGHGVGLCQMGGIVMATRGYDYAEILKHYFEGVEIYRVYQ